MKKIYAILDVRDNEEKEFVTDPLILDNDIQASMAYAQYLNQIKIGRLSILRDLRLYHIGNYLNNDITNPIKPLENIKEIAVNLNPMEEEADNE